MRPVLRSSLPASQRRAAVPRRCRRCPAPRADSGYSPQQFGLAPAQPKTPYGEMLQYYLKMEPQLFKTAVQDQLDKLQAEKDAKAKAERAAKAESLDKTDLALYRRMEEVRASEIQATLEDLLYLTILERFVLLGVDMLPRMDGFVDAGAANLKVLTESIHSMEALELLKEHILGMMGPSALNQFSNVTIKISKYQMAQVYAASIMFGYFLRRVDTRFQLEKALGTLQPSKEEAVARLERLFAQADSVGSSSDPDSPSGQLLEVNPDAPLETPTPAVTGAGQGQGEELRPAPRKKSALRTYVETFDQATVVEMARMVSVEGAALVERQTSALFGDIKQLAAQMQGAVGGEASSVDDLMQRLQAAVANNVVETLTMSVGTQRRAVLEAVAFGTFLRDAEAEVQGKYDLLTLRTALPPRGGGAAGPSGDVELL